VFVQTRPGEFEPRAVELAYLGPKEVVVASGLQIGEQVVSDNALLLARQFRLAQNEAKAPANAAPDATKTEASNQPARGAAQK
jgi:cobalt-zinc-cadmium efflux system membrane fusion protein